MDKNMQDLLDMTQLYGDMGYAVYNPQDNSVYLSYNIYTLLDLTPTDDAGARFLELMSSDESLRRDVFYTNYKEYNGRRLIVTRISLNDSKGIMYLFILLTYEAIDRMVERAQEFEELNLESIHTRMAAHEIKNSMTVIKGFLQLLKVKYEQDADFIDLMLDEVERANGLTAGFMRGPRSAEGSGETVRVNIVLDGLVRKLKLVLTDRYILKTHFEETHEAQITAKALEQVCLNLILNSVDAMNGGTIYICTDVLKNGLIRIRIADNGCGIAAGIRDKVFSYGFTTKAEGTGYGLAIVSAILGRYNSKIRLTSREGKGSIFTVLLPSAGI